VRVISVSQEGEFSLIARIAARLTEGPGVLLGAGDDAAVVAAPDGRVVASTDLLVEGRHFRRDWSSAYDVGRRAAAANLADIVAMGAQPTSLLVGLAVPGDLPIEWVESLADGLRDEAALVGASIIGGDLSGSEAVTVAVTALGDLRGRAPVTRSGAQPGDAIVLIGRPGRAAAGLALLTAGRRDHLLVAAHRRPDVRYAEALALAERGATAMIDVSDGLVADLGHVAAASGVRIELIGAAIPVDEDVAAVAEELGVDVFDWLAGGGDDHCFAASIAAEATSELTVIGTVVVGEGSVVVVDREAPKLSGHEHFRS